MEKHYDRRSFPKMAGFGTAAVCLNLEALMLSGCAPPKKDKPNFLIILVDDMGFGDPGCFGNKIIKTPNIDQLCAEGMKLTDCYAAAPVCSPARAGLLTGRVPHRCGVYDWISDAKGHNYMHLPKNEITVSSILKKAGYATSVVGKWHLNGKMNSPEQPQPNDFGFDHWFVTGMNLKQQLNPNGFIRNGKKVETTKGYACEVVVNEAIHWLEKERGKNKPFFQCLWFHEPHEPIDAPPDLVEMYADHDGTKPLYYANVTNLDRQIGRVLKQIGEIGERDNTVVFFTSDNGPAQLAKSGYRSRSHGSAGPFREYKWTLFEGGIRVPGIIRWPGNTKPGEVCREPVSGVDFLPTVCSILGEPLPADRCIDGADISPVFQGKSINRKTPLHWHYSSSYAGPQSVMHQEDFTITADWDIEHPVMGRFKKETIQSIKKANLTNFKLYNVSKDPGQIKDISGEEAVRFESMKKQLINLYKGVQEEVPDWGIEF